MSVGILHVHAALGLVHLSVHVRDEGVPLLALQLTFHERQRALQQEKRRPRGQGRRGTGPCSSAGPGGLGLIEVVLRLLVLYTCISATARMTSDRHVLAVQGDPIQQRCQVLLLGHKIWLQFLIY